MCMLVGGAQPQQGGPAAAAASVLVGGVSLWHTWLRGPAAKAVGALVGMDSPFSLGQECFGGILDLAGDPCYCRAAVDDLRECQS